MAMVPVDRRVAALLIVVLALIVRLATVRFGLPALNDPDELMFELGAMRMLREGTLDPGWFGHPATTTMYVLAVTNAGVYLIGTLLGLFNTPAEFVEALYQNPAWAILPGRVAMTLFAAGTVWMTWRIGTRLFGARAGLFAALLLAIDPLHVTWSQIIRSDGMACFFMLLCLNACCDIAERADWKSYLRAGLWLAFAVATKWPFALVALAIAFASGAAAQAAVASRRTILIRLGLSIPATLVMLVVISPYLVLDYTTVISNLKGERQLYHLGSNGGGVIANLWWYLSGPLATGFGFFGLVLVGVGLARLPRSKVAFAVLAPVMVGFIVLFALQHVVWARWALPLLPIGAILAGAAADAGVSRLRAAGPTRVVLLAVGTAAVILPLGLNLWSSGRERMHDTRQIATHWARANIPASSTVIVEHFAFDLLPQPWTFLFPLGEAGCVNARALLRGKTEYTLVAQARGARTNVDYGTIARKQEGSCRADFAILTHYHRYSDERATFPAAYATYRRLIERGRVVATIEPKPHHRGGPTVTIVDLRPRP